MYCLTICKVEYYAWKNAGHFKTMYPSTGIGWWDYSSKGLRLAGMKMMQLTDELLSEHYAHLSGKPFFQRVKDSMMTTPVIVCCFEGVDAIQTVRTLAGPTNGRLAAPGINEIF